jgi:hypothetical protein
MSDGGLRALVRKRMPTAHWQSVETSVTGGGTPDSNYCFPGGVEGWVEFKATKAWKVSFRPAQVGWIDRRTRLGGRVHVMVSQLRVDGEVLWVVAGRHVIGLAENGLKWVESELFSGNGLKAASRFHKNASRFSAVRHDFMCFRGGRDKWDFTQVKQFLILDS